MSDPGPCIYAIVQIDTDRAYVGSTIQLDRRWRTHLLQLRKGTHHCAHLQRAWAKHGAGAFRWEILEAADVEGLTEVETRWIGARRERAGVFNTAPVGGSTRGLKLGPQSEAHRAKIGAAQRGKKISEAQKALVSAVHKGKSLSATHKAVISETMRNRVHSPSTRAKLSESARNLSDESRALRSASLKRAMTPERRTAMAEAARNISDETRAKRAASLRAYWASKREAA